MDTKVRSNSCVTIENISSGKTDEIQSIDIKCFNFLETENPDKEIEFFWITFKHSIFPYVGDVNTKRIELLSAKLNNLQKIQKYDDIKYKISEFMCVNTESICNLALVARKKIFIRRLSTNIARWTKMDNDYANIVSDSLKIKLFIAISRSMRRRAPDDVHLMNIVLKFFSEQSTCDNDATLHELFEYSCNKYLVTIVEILIHYIDINRYFLTNDDCGKYKNYSGLKISKIIETRLLHMPV